MLFLSLLVYFLTFPLAYNLVCLYLPAWSGLPRLWAVAFLMLVVSAILIKFMVMMIDVYYPSLKGRLRNLTRVMGVRWLCWLAVFVIVASCVIVPMTREESPGPLFWCLLLPALFISFVNGIGIEINQKQLEEMPEPGRVILPQMPALPEMKDEIVKTFQWSFQGKDYSLSLVIRRSVHEELAGRKRVLDHPRWSQEYALDGITGEIRELSHGLCKMGTSFGSYEEVDFVLSFVREVIRYQTEEVEYPKYPVETLVDGTGDCEDFSILGAAILKCVGYEVALLFVPGHAALGVAGAVGLPGSYVEHGGVNYYYCEMTAEGWKIGEIPEEYQKATIAVSPVPAFPAKVLRPEPATVSST